MFFFAIAIFLFVVFPSCRLSAHIYFFCNLAIMEAYQLSAALRTAFIVAPWVMVFTGTSIAIVAYAIIAIIALFDRQIFHPVNNVPMLCATMRHFLIAHVADGKLFTHANG